MDRGGGDGGGGGLTEGSHGWVLEARLDVPGGQVGPGVVAALVVVVLDVEAGELGEADPQGAAGVVDVLTVQRLEHTHTHTRGPGFRGQPHPAAAARNHPNRSGLGGARFLLVV